MKSLLTRLIKDEEGAVLPFYAVFLCMIAIPLMLYIINMIGYFTAITEVQVAADDASLAASGQQNNVYEEWETSQSPHEVHTKNGSSCDPGWVYGGTEHHYDTTEQQAWDKAQQYLSLNNFKFISGLEVTNTTVVDHYVYPNGDVYTGGVGLDKPIYNGEIPAATTDSVHNPTVTITVHATYTPLVPLLSGTYSITKSSQSNMSYTGSNKQVTNTLTWMCGEAEPNPFA